MIKRLAIGPGAMGFFLYLGFVSKLKHEGRLDALEAISGASAGGLLGFLFLATKGDLSKVLDFALEVPVKQIMKPNIKNFLKDHGLVSTRKIRRVLSNACVKFMDREDVTFEELYEWWHVKFYVSAYCVDLMKTVYFSVDSHPKLSVLDAVSASVAIPFLFTSLTMNDGWTYIDGGSAEATPAGPFLGLGDVLALKLAWSRPSPIHDFKTYALNILYSTMRLRAIYEVPTLDLDLGDSDVFDFGASNEGKLKMFLKGHALNFS